MTIRKRFSAGNGRPRSVKKRPSRPVSSLSWRDGDMVRFRKDRPGLKRVLTCACCGEEITDALRVHLLRDDYALPEEPTYYLHPECAERFQREHVGHWHPISLSSLDASWVL
jgi:hypothetical protein